MKRILTILALFIGLILPAKADVMPYYVNNINTNSIGVYQAPNNVKVFQEPNDNAKILFEANWSNQTYDCPVVSARNLFVVYLPKRDLAFLTVIDESDDENWVQITYSQDGSQKGWIKKDDAFRFMTWRTFFNIYGRKYGLYYMKDAPECSKILYGTGEDNAQQIGQITYTEGVKVTAVKGNWILAVAIDVDRSQKIGWIKWRDISGAIYLFPDIK